MAAPLTAALLAVVPISIAVLSCGRSELPAPMPVLPPIYRPLEGTAAPLWVEPGYTWVGNMEFEPVTGGLVPMPCEEAFEAGGFAHGYLVAGFFLDADEVRGKDYLACVSAGACPEVTVEPELAATLEAGALEAYCAFRGGRLPLASEFARASSGDEVGLTTETFYRAWLACDDTNFEGEECASLAARAPIVVLHERTSPLPIRADPRDVGPFGHWDLYGSQIELTATFDGVTLDGEDVPVCQHPNWFLEAPSVPRPPQPPPAANGEDLRLGHAPAWALASRSGLRARAAIGEGVIPYWIFTHFKEVLLHGGRCAYDPAYELEE